MAARIGTCAAVLCVAALAACSGGGGGGGSGDAPPESGIADPGSITGASPAYINSLNSQFAIINSSVVLAGRTDLPQNGTATYSGFGTIYDASVTNADNTAALLRGRSVVTDVSGTATFGAAPTVNITQTNFRDVDGNQIPGSVTWTTNYDSEGLFNATVAGDVGGTTFVTGADQARVGFYGDTSGSALIGTFSEAPVGTSGALRGSSISGEIAATSN
jgi:hypothetical protein